MRDLRATALVACAVLAPPPSTQEKREKLELGRATFAFADPTCPADAPLPVHTYLPKGLKKDAPVLFVLHGKNRNALDYRDVWIPLAEESEFLLVCPEFSAANFPSSDAYNCGRLFDDAGALRPEELWTFSVLERLFDEVRSRARSSAESYVLYGHSAGAQFVHRLVLLAPRARFERAVAANAGWYTSPSLETAFPYGLKGVPEAESRLSAALERRLTVLLGDQDTDTEDPDLRTTPEAMAQGPHRLARGQNFLAAAQAFAKERSTTCAWTLETVPGAGHSNAQMSRAAAEVLFAMGKVRKGAR